MESVSKNYANVSSRRGFREHEYQRARALAHLIGHETGHVSEDVFALRPIMRRVAIPSVVKLSHDRK